jgi:hypothetical protein
MLLACTSLLVLHIASAPPVVAGDYEFRGQASAWLSQIHSSKEWHTGAGGHYLPQLTIGMETGRRTYLDLEASLEAYAEAGRPGRSDTALADLYRLKLRFVTPRTESRLGLQQINFGPAYLLRPLRWFDTLDPRDPLGLSDGVYALSFKYVGQGNESLWLWGLYGNEDPKGQEVFPTLKYEPEFGGRLELQVPAGEAAFSFHHRRVDGPEPLIGDFVENRFGLDARWDVKIGIWFEGALFHQDSDQLPYDWRKLLTLGADYTFSVGNGLHSLLEHMAIVSSQEALGWDTASNISGLSFGYFYGFSDRFSFIPFYLWEEQEYSLYAAWEHYWDNLSLSLIASRYPETDEAMPGTAGPQAGGYGVQVMLIFNH